MRNTFLFLFGSDTPKFALGILTFLIASFSLAGCTSRPPEIDQPPRQTTLLADRVELPTTFFKGRPYVDLKINGKGPYRFLVDTGAKGFLITPRVVREARIPVSRKSVARVWGASGKFEMLRIGLIDRVESPLFSLRGISASIAGPQTLHFDQKIGDGDYGGIVGMSTLHDVLLEIDYPQRKVSVARLGRATLSTDRDISYTEITPLVTITTPSAKHATTTARIDTGSEGGFDFTDIASYPLRVGLAKLDQYHYGIGGYWRPLFGQLAGDICLGSAIWRDAKIHSANENRIGSEALAPWKLVIDQQKKMLWLLDENQTSTTTWTGPLDPDGRPAVYGFVSLAEGDSSVVKEVDPGSRAERAGLKVGDVVLPQNEDAIARERAQKNDPFFVRLRIVRGAETLEITLSLLDPLPAPAKPPP